MGKLKKVLKKATGIKVVSKMIGSVSPDKVGKAKQAQLAKEQATPIMPDPDDEAVKAARRRSLLMQTNRRGRESTIYSDKLG